MNHDSSRLSTDPPWLGEPEYQALELERRIWERKQALDAETRDALRRLDDQARLLQAAKTQ